MKQAQRKQPVVSVDNAPGEVIILPPVQVRRTTPTVTRWLRELTQRLLPPLLGLGVLLLAWQLAAMHSKGFPDAAEHAGLGADPVWPIRSIRTGPMTWASAGTCWPPCSAWRWASPGGAGGHSAGVFDRPFAVLRPHV